MQFLCLVNGTPRSVPISQMKFRVDGDLCHVVGTWHEGKPYAPNREQFRAALPQRWRKAFDRACAGVPFWHGKHTEQCSISLSDRRGRYLATVYCQPIQDPDATDSAREKAVAELRARRAARGMADPLNRLRAIAHKSPAITEQPAPRVAAWLETKES